MQKIWEETERQIEVVNNHEPIEYRKNFMKIRFESDDDLPLGKTFNILDMMNVAAICKNVIVGNKCYRIWSVTKYWSEVFLFSLLWC